MNNENNNENKDNNNEYVKELVWDDYKSGDRLEGILVDILSGIGEYGSTLYKLQNDDGFYAVWGSSKLDEQMNKVGVQIGMRIRIAYNGLIRTANGFDMKDFTVIILD